MGETKGPKWLRAARAAGDPVLTPKLERLYFERRADRLHKSVYRPALEKLQGELIAMQDFAVATGAKILVIFEGRDAAGKGGVIKAISEELNARVCRIVALPKPTERERSEWYFQRYVAHLPAGGEIVLFDRSWYNRAGVERVMGFATEAEVETFFEDVPAFERMLVRSGIILLKYWLSISDAEQQLRLLARVHDPMKHWKLSPMDLDSWTRWDAYTRARDEMLARTSSAAAPWFVVEGDDKRRARLNCIAHLLSQVPYEAVEREAVRLPPRVREGADEPEPLPKKLFVPERY